MTQPEETGSEDRTRVHTDQTGQMTNRYVDSCGETIGDADRIVEDLVHQQTPGKWGEQPGATTFKDSYVQYLQDICDELSTRSGELDDLKTEMGGVIRSFNLTEEEQLSALNSLHGFLERGTAPSNDNNPFNTNAPGPAPEKPEVPFPTLPKSTERKGYIPYT